MIQLFEQDIRTIDRQSSKGNQLKWENHGIWYKADYTGYEGLSEYVVSHLVRKSSLRREEFVLYNLEQMQYKGKEYNGSKSENFLTEGWQIVTLERLFHNFFGHSLYTSIFKIADHEKRLEFLVGQVERMTGLKEFGIYLNKLFTIDALFLNEDRHTHNIAVLMNESGEFAYCPIFDNGAGLLSDTQMDYPLHGDVYLQMKEAKAKTICESFDEQLDISENLFGENIKFSFTESDVKELLQGATAYEQTVKNRVERIV